VILNITFSCYYRYAFDRFVYVFGSSDVVLACL
jgi:hypothetical protein